LHKLYPESKKIPAVIEFVDIAGLVKNAHKGEGLGNQFLSNIRNVDVIVEVVRAFEDTNIQHTEEKIDPLRDIDTIHTELILADIEMIKRRKEKLEKKRRSTGKEKEEADIEWEILEIYEQRLNNNQWLYPLPELPDKLKQYEEDLLKSFPLLSVKPLLYTVNIKKDREKIISNFKEKGIAEEKVIFLDIKLEKEIGEMSGEEQNELELKSSLDNLVQHSFNLLNILTFFTTGEDETRAWITKKGNTAPQASGVIHSHFEKLFIKAAIINYKDLIKTGSYKTAREKGLVRTEGKEYIIQEGDVIEVFVGK